MAGMSYNFNFNYYVKHSMFILVVLNHVDTSSDLTTNTSHSLRATLFLSVVLNALESVSFTKFLMPF